MVGWTEEVCVVGLVVGICVGSAVGPVGLAVDGWAEDGAEVGLQVLEDLACNLRERRLCLGTESLLPDPSFIRR